MSQEAPRRRRRIDPDNGGVSTVNAAATAVIDDDDSPLPPAKPTRSAPDFAARSDEPVVAETRTRSSLPKEDDDPADDTVQAVYGIGRKAVEEAKRMASSNFYFRWDEEGEPILIRFLAAPPVFYESRWINRSGRKSFPYIGKGDPLEALGVKRTQKIRYQIANFSQFDQPVVQIFEVTPSVDEILVKLDEDSTKGPLVERWYEVSRMKPSAKAFNYNYTIRAVKPRDVEEDWGIDLTEAEEDYRDLEVIPEDKMVPSVSMAELREVAEEIMGVK